MTDPRNVAHDKKVQQEKKHRHQEMAPGSDQAVQPGRKPHMTPHTDTAVPAAQEQETDPARHRRLEAPAQGRRGWGPRPAGEGVRCRVE